jgi:hypothetical protein
MPKRSFPFHSCSPLQMKTHVNSLHVDKESHMLKVYGKDSSSFSFNVRLFTKVILICIKTFLNSFSCSKNHRSSEEGIS